MELMVTHICIYIVWINVGKGNNSRSHETNGGREKMDDMSD